MCLCVWCVCVLFVHLFQKTPTQVSLYKSHTTEEPLRGRRSAGTVRYCLDIRDKSGNSCGCCFHHIRGSVSLGTCWTCMSPDEEFRIIVFGPSFVLLTSTKYYGLPPDEEEKKNPFHSSREKCLRVFILFSARQEG